MFFTKNTKETISTSPQKKDTKSGFLDLFGSNYQSEELILPQELTVSNNIKKGYLEYYHKLTKRWKKNWVILKPTGINIYSSQDVNFF